MLSKQLRPVLFAALLSAAPVLYGQTTTYPITQDTYIDSSLPTYNAGSFNKVKAVDNPASEQHPGMTSTTRALFYLPAVQTGFWTALDNAITASESYTVTVSYYAANNSLPGYYNSGHFNGSDPRDVELHPMTDSWAVGSANYAPNASGSPGATWDTSDGTTPWTNTAEFPTDTYTDTGFTTSYATNVGGDYDIKNYVTDTTGSVSPANSGPFTWNITSLLSGGPGTTTYDELYNYGALLKVNDDTTYDTDGDVQYFLSLDSAEAAAGLTPFVTLNIAPEPACIVPGMALLLLAGYNRRRK